MASIEIKSPQKTPFSPAFNAQKWATFGAISTGILGAFVSNASAPEQIDLSISGWVVGASQANQGPVPRSIFASQTDTTQIQPSVWKPVVGNTPRVPPYTAGGIPQADPTQVSARLWPSQFSPPAPAAQPLRSIFAAPESADLSISAWVLGSALANQVAVPSFVFAQQSNPTQLAPSTWKSQPAPIVITPGPLASFVQAAPEWVDLSISGWTVGTSQFSAATSGPLASFFAVPPQLDDRQTRTVWSSVIGYANPSAPEYRFGTHAKAIHEAEARKSSIWKSQPAAPPVGAVPAQTRGTPQADPSLNQTKVWTPSTFTAPTVGATVSPIFVVPPQFDFTVNAARIWGPGLTPALPLPQVGGIRIPQAKAPPARASRQLVISKRYVEQLLGEPTEEAQFLESVSAQIAQAEKPTQAPIAREIGQLSALNALAGAYQVHFETVAAARAAIEQRQIELEEDDLMAVLMILAIADEP